LIEVVHKTRITSSEEKNTDEEGEKGKKTGKRRREAKNHGKLLI
jgi:hypothetical protein